VWFLAFFRIYLKKYALKSFRNTPKNACKVLRVKKRKALKMLDFQGFLNGGEEGIRTLVGLPPNGFQEVYQRIPFQLSSVQFVLKQFPKILIL